MKKRSLKAITAVLLAMTMLAGTSVMAFASTAKVSDGSVRIRSEASTSGSVVGTGSAGDTFTILENVSGADGYTWYKIQVNGTTTGYVRGDLVKVTEDANNNNESQPNSTDSQAPTEATPITETTATINGDAAVNIRSGAGTSYAKVASLDAGTSVTLTAEANDASGNKWYHLKCESKNVEGYIRSDLLNISSEITPLEGEGGEDAAGENQEVEEPEATPEPTPEPVPENNDYEIVYTTDEEGVYQYYLYDHVQEQRMKVKELLDTAINLKSKYKEATDKVAKMTIVAAVAGVCALIFFILMIIFIIRANGSHSVEYYEADFGDDDDDEDDDTYEADEDDEAEYVPTKRPARPTRNAEPARSPRQDKPAQQAPARRPRRAQNFLANDDEFEFEFLNMDDKE